MNTTFILAMNYYRSCVAEYCSANDLSTSLTYVPTPTSNQFYFPQCHVVIPGIQEFYYVRDSVLIAMVSLISMTSFVVIFFLPKKMNSISLHKSLPILERSLTPMEDQCDLVVISQRKDRITENQDNTQRAQFVYSHHDALSELDEAIFVLSQCLVLAAGPSFNITHLVGVTKKLQLLKPFALAVVKNTRDLRLDTRLSANHLHTPFPLLIIEGGKSGDLKNVP